MRLPQLLRLLHYLEKKFDSREIFWGGRGGGARGLLFLGIWKKLIYYDLILVAISSSKPWLVHRYWDLTVLLSLLVSPITLFLLLLCVCRFLFWCFALHALINVVFSVNEVRIVSQTNDVLSLNLCRSEKSIKKILRLHYVSEQKYPTPRSMTNLTNVSIFEGQKK